MLRRELKDISPLNLPVLLLLGNGRTAVLRRFAEDGKALILPGNDSWKHKKADEPLI